MVGRLLLSPWNLASKKGLARERMSRWAARVDPSDSLKVTSEKVPWGGEKVEVQSTKRLESKYEKRK